MLFGKPSRRAWILAIAASVLCVGGLLYALISDWNAEPHRSLEAPRQVASGGSGFSLGLAIGIGAGVVIGSLLAIRGRKHDAETAPKPKPPFDS